MSETTLPTFYIPHGGGPCFDIEWADPLQAGIDDLGAWLAETGQVLLAAPHAAKAILIITAHWETAQFTVSTNPKPGMLYDYTGFPPHTYQLKYDAPGSPEVADLVVQACQKAGLDIKTDSSRAFDHGTFVPLRKMFPSAELPVVQLSIQKGWNPQAHIALGAALQSLRKEGILILGSGMSFHNFDTFMRPEGMAVSIEFDEWLTQIAESESEVRNEELTGWDSAPGGRGAHPAEDHLIPLMVIAGAARNDLGKRVFHGSVLGVMVSAYQFG